MKTGCLVLILLACAAASSSAAAPEPSITISVGYSSSYEWFEGMGIRNHGTADLTLAIPLGGPVLLVPSIGVARYSGEVGNAVGDVWNVTLDMVPIGVGARIQVPASRVVQWYAQESALLIYYHWREDACNCFSGYSDPEDRKSALLGLKVATGFRGRITGATFGDVGIGYVLSEDLDTFTQGLRQFVPYVGVGAEW